MDKTDFFAYLKKAEDRVLGYIRQSDVARFFHPPIIEQAVWAYPERSAKRLRPAVLLMSAGCMGDTAKEDQAVPAAAGVELFHTWTLVHDDIIDNDTMRRFEPTAHVQATDTALRTLPLSRELATEFGRDVAMLAGDMQHGWSITAFSDCALQSDTDPTLLLQIIRCLQSYVLGELISGETLDVQYGMTHAVEALDLSEDEIEHMLWLKTGVLYEFAGWAGALIGAGQYVPIDTKKPSSPTEEAILAIRSFTSNCGTAFQLQDDILGIVGVEEDLGKPVGSDIREGKQTVIVHEALKNAEPAQKEKILSVLGNKAATPEDISQVSNLFREHGVERAKERARGYIEKARQHLPHIPDGHHKELLRFWADFMINREF
ncbi:MAG: polyprenyl synthetase family protein [Verrucomicrobia bacterium]|nr:polyprenyl synthetase family protein [Verrucomicrobiota bacterium]